MSPPRPRILLVDDEQYVVSGLHRALSRRTSAFEIATACSAAEALVALAVAPCAVVVSDLQMPGINGLELLDEIARVTPHVGRVLLTGTAEADAASRALPTAQRFLCKPASVKTIADTCQDLYRYARLAQLAGPPVEGGGEPLAVGSITALAIDAATIARARIAASAGHDALLQVIDHPALAAALLHMTGSEFLGARTEVSTLSEAIALVGTLYFEQMIDSGLLLALDGAAADPIVALAQRGRARMQSAVDSGASQTDALAALLLEVDRLGTSDTMEWSGLRDSCNPAALLGLWGAPALLVERIAERHATAVAAGRLGPPRIASAPPIDPDDHAHVVREP
jgi:ActR/RegA family two-component response regulator